MPAIVLNMTMEEAALPPASSGGGGSVTHTAELSRPLIVRLSYDFTRQGDTLCMWIRESSS